MSWLDEHANKLEVYLSNDDLVTLRGMIDRRQIQHGNGYVTTDCDREKERGRKLLERLLSKVKKT